MQLETGGPEGPQNRCSRAGETTTFPKRYALVYVYVKQYYLQLGPCWDGPGLAQGVGAVFARAAPCRPESGMATHRPMLPCGRNGNFLQKVRSRLRKTTIQARRPIAQHSLINPAWRAGARNLARRRMSPGPTWTNFYTTAQKALSDHSPTTPAPREPPMPILPGSVHQR